MSNFLTLLKTFIKTTELTSAEKKRSKHFYKIMGTAVVLLIMIPAGLLVGIITYALTLGVMSYDGTTQGANVILHIISILSVIFGINVIINIFYFSNDIENLIPLPLKPREIVSAKFAYSLLSENIMEFILILGACAGFMCAHGFSATGIVASLIGILTVPIIPLAYCGIIAVIFMYFTHSVKNRDFLNKITGIGTAVLIVGSLVALVSVSGFNPEAIVSSLASADNGFLNVMNIIFPHIPLMMDSIAGDGACLLILYLLANVVVVAIFLFLASKMYIKGVSDINTTKSRRSKSIAGQAIEKSVQKDIFASYLKKEFLVLFRTPPFFMDCIAINLLWPVFMAVIMILQGSTNFLSGVLTPYLAGDRKSITIITVSAVVISALVTAINSIASSSISREGKHFQFMRYIPVGLRTQINAKALASIIISGSVMVLYVIAFNVYCAILATTFNPFVFIVTPLIHIALSLICVVFVTYLGIFLDTINPKLVWDDEINALRGNYNTVINAAIIIAITAAICTISLVLLWIFSVEPAIINLGLVIVMCVLAVAAQKVCLKKGVANLEQIES